MHVESSYRREMAAPFAHLRSVMTATAAGLTLAGILLSPITGQSALASQATPGSRQHHQASGTSTVQAASSVSWPMAGYNLQHTGENRFESTLSTSNIASASHLWDTNVGGTYIDDQPVVAANVTVGATTENLLYVGDEHGNLTALNATTGTVVWQRTLGWQLGGSSNPDCQNSPFGISDSPAIDASSNTLYVVDGTNQLYALDMSTGATKTGWPISISTDSINEHVWSGLSLMNGMLYVPVASECDAGPYRGRLVAVNTSTATIAATFYVNGKTGAAGGGIWGYAGASFSTSGKFAFVGTGNALGPNPNAGHSDSAVKLNVPNLTVSATNNPGIAGLDNDFGSTPVLFQQSGCPAEFALENKNGMLYLYDQGRVHLGPVQSLQISTASSADLIGDVAWSATDDLLFVGNGAGQAPYPSGLLAFRLVHMNGTCELSPAWQAALGPAASVVPPPVVANGVVYYADGTGKTIYALDETTGAVLFSATLPDYIMTSPIVVNGMLYVPDWNGRVYAFGLPAPAPPRAEVTSGWDHTLGLDDSGTVYAWGNNSSGQLGDGTTTGSSVPVQVSGFPSGVSIMQVAGGYHFSLARDSAGNVWAWGDNSNYQLGVTAPSESSTPVQVPGLTQVVSIAAGFNFALALKSDGTLWAWGSNWDGQLGNGTTSATPVATPVEVRGISGVTALSAGAYHALAVSGGSVYAWGYNGFGELGDGSTNLSDVPVLVPGLPTALSVAGGAYHSLVLGTDGSVWSFGRNDEGELGNGSTTSSDVPVQIPGVTAQAIAAGGFHSLVEEADGTLWATGSNTYGQLGDNSTVSSDVLVQVSGVTSPVGLAAGAYDSFALSSNGDALGFGSNADGRLGNGTTTDSSTPVMALGFDANA